MAQLAMGTAGAWVGSFFGPLGASIGFSLGSAIGGALFGPKAPNGPRLNDLKLQTSQYGQMIPIVWGRVRGAGIVIDQTDLTEHAHSSSGKGSDGPTTYTYSASFQVLIAEGPILGIGRIWADGRVIYDTTGGSGVDNSAIPLTTYLGSETQLPDPTFEGIHGTGNVSAYRGYAYVTFTDMDLSDYSNRLPNLEFEIYTHATGNIPWRVNYIRSSAPLNSPPFWWNTGSGNADKGLVYVGDGKVKAYSYTGGFASYWEDNWKDCFLTNVSPVPNPDLPGVGGDPCVFDGGGRAIVEAIAYGINCCYCVNNANTGWAAWFVGSGQGTIIKDHPDGSGGGPHGSYVADSVQNEGVYDGGGIWAAWKNNVTGAFGIAKWAPGGSFGNVIPLNTVLPLGVTATSIKFGVSELGDVFVGYADTSPGTHGDGLIWLSAAGATKFFWNNTDPAHSTPANFTVSHGFCAYHNYIASEFGGGLINNRHFQIWKVDPIAFTITAGGSLDEYGSFSTRAYAGFVLSADGVFSLDPPDLFSKPQVPLYEIVGGGGAVRGLSERAGLNSTQFDASELTDMVTGFRLADQGAIRGAVETLQPAYKFDAVERDVLVAFPKRGALPTITIPLSDLPAYQDGQEPPEPRKFTHGHEDDVPRQVMVVYLDETADFQPGAQPEQRRVGNAQSPINIQLPIAMTPDLAKNIAHVNLLQAEVERDSYEFPTSRKYAYLGPADVVTVIDQIVRITEEDAAPTGVVAWKSVQTVPQIYRDIAESVPGDGFTEPTATTTQSTTAFLLNLPLLTDLDSSTGYYVAMCGATDSTWRGAALFQSRDGGSTYTQVATVGTASVIGTVASALGNFVGGRVIDEVNSMTVTIGVGGGELASCTRDALYAGANLAAVGSGSTWEVIQYMRATLIATDTYVLTGFRRGRRGSEWAMSLHGASEHFIALPATQVAVPLGDLGVTFQYKAVTTGQSISDVAGVDFINTGEAARPYTPAQLGGGVNGSGDLLISFRRRTRQGGEWKEFIDVPMTEPAEGYVVEIWNSTFTVCARTIETTSQGTAYTATMQIADFGAAQSSYYVSAGQKGLYQLGRRATATLPGSGSTLNAPLSPITPYNGTTP